MSETLQGGDMRMQSLLGNLPCLGTHLASKSESGRGTCFLGSPSPLNTMQLWQPNGADYEDW